MPKGSVALEHIPEEEQSFPQPGPQTIFLESLADIGIYGGAAGSGKSFALLLEPLRHMEVKNFTAVIFRRTTVNIRNPGALWDESNILYSQYEGAVPSDSHLTWEFPPHGSYIKMAHMEHENDKLGWHGAQVPLIMFDELTEFTSTQFFYMLSRNRSMTGIRPYIRATCNPDADSWVAGFIAWWIDQETGLPIPERSGVLRWFIRLGDRFLWADSREWFTPKSTGLKAHEIRPKSVTFISATIYDNKKLMEADPNYLSNLLAMNRVDRERLLGGNWKVRPLAGEYFQREWCEVIDAVPAGLEINRGWDMAATKKTETNNPDFTASTKIGRDDIGYTYILDYIEMQESAGGVERAIKNTASQDAALHGQHGFTICLAQDPGQAGKAQVAYYVRQLPKFAVKFSPESGDKLSRFKPFSSQAEAGNVKVLRGPWNELFFQRLESVPDGGLDTADSVSRAFNSFLTALDGMIQHMRKMNRDKKAKVAESKIQEPAPSKDTGGVAVVGPEGINMILDRKGRQLLADKNGHFIVDPKHAIVLVARAGFKYVEGTQ